MTPYRTTRLEAWPDKGDLGVEGRPSRLVKITSRSRRAARRALRKRDRRAARASVDAELSSRGDRS